MRQKTVIAKNDGSLLQNASVIAKCDRTLLPRVSGVTKCDSCCIMRRNTGHELVTGLLTCARISVFKISVFI